MTVSLKLFENNGKIHSSKTLSQEEYLHLLDKKMDEKLAEDQKSKSPEALADLLDVIQAVVKARGWTLEELKQVRADRTGQTRWI